MKYNLNIFKAYDIRGLVEEISPEIAYNIGRAFVEFLKKNNAILENKKIIVGRDMRPSSPVFQKEIMRAVQDSGVNVLDIGLVSTPLFNFACTNYSFSAGGIMITASHNPAKYNGFKLTLENGLPVGKESGMDEIKNMVEKENFSVSLEKGEITTKNVLDDYLIKIMSFIDVHSLKSLKIVIDAGNGMAKVTFPKLLEKLPVTVEYLYLEPDGNFPNHEANPLKTETLKDLQKKVVETKSDFGFALDGDCDRIGLVDEKGEIVEASYVGALIGLEVLKNHPKSLMLYDLRSSQIVKEVWENEGAKTTECRVGHAFIKKQMKETGAIFASELSQHLYYHDLCDLESSDLSLLYLLQILSREQKALSAIIEPFKKYAHSGEINFEVENKTDIINKIEEKYNNDAKEIHRLDGISMMFDWGWFNIRTSNTEPVLRLNLEAKDKFIMEEKIKQIKQIIHF